MIEARGLSCARGSRVVLRGVDLALPPGEIVGVLGANGAGKSTLLATLAGELPPAAGTLTLEGQPLPHWRADALARRRAVLPQSPSLAFDLAVREVVAMGLYPHPHLGPAQAQSLTDEALHLAGLADAPDRRYTQMSGGEQQRVHFARIVAQLLGGQVHGSPGVLLLDEPTASLDPRHQIALLRAVRELVRRHASAALLILHDVNLAAQWCDRLLLLGKGRVIASGEPPQVLTPAHLEAVYELPVRVIEHPGQPDRPLVLFDAP